MTVPCGLAPPPRASLFFIVRVNLNTQKLTLRTARTMAEILPKNIINRSKIFAYYRKRCILSNFTWAGWKIQTKWVVFPKTWHWSTRVANSYHIYTNWRVSAFSTFHSQFTLAHQVSFGNPGRRCRTCQLFYVDDFGNLIPIVNTHSVFFPKINTHSGDCAQSNSTKLGPGEVEGRGRGRGEDKIWMKFKKIYFQIW